jgi:hypothetical protein
VAIILDDEFGPFPDELYEGFIINIKNAKQCYIYMETYSLIT